MLAERTSALLERERANLAERTPRVAALFERASRVLPGGVTSSFQAREPWPVYLDSRRGRARVGRGRPRVRRLPQRLQRHGAGPRPPGDRAPRSPRASRRAPISPRRARTPCWWPRSWRGAGHCRSGASPTRARRPPWRAIRLARALTRARAGAAHRRLLPRPQRHDDGQAAAPASPRLWRARCTTWSSTTPPPSSGPIAAARAGLRGHGGRDDRHRGSAPRAGLPRGRARNSPARAAC